MSPRALTRQLTIRLPADLAVQFERLAEHNDRSLNREVSRAVTAYVQAHQSDGPAMTGPSATAVPVGRTRANGSSA